MHDSQWTTNFTFTKSDDPLADADTRRALIEQAYQLNELTKHPGWAILVDFMLTKMKTDKQRVLDGVVTNLDDYKKLTGYFQGAHAVLNAPETVEKLAANARRREAESHEPPDAA